MGRDYEIDNEQILVKTSMPFAHLIEMEICHDINTHAFINLQVVVKEENQEDVLNTNWSGTSIEVLKKGEENSPLFIGFIEKLLFQKENQFLTVIIRAVGETAKLDRQKKMQSFQNVKMTYKQVVQAIINDYENAEVIWNVDGEKEIGSPIIQYNETDWKFLMRLCSHFHGVLTSDLRTGKPTVFMGMNVGKERSMVEVEILGCGFDSNYFQNGCYEDEIPRRHAFYLKIKARENWQIGDFGLYEGKKYSVFSRNITFKHGELFFIYHIGMQGAYYRKKNKNEALKGVRLEGVIRKTEKENVYLQLNIDKEEKADYPWIWAPETNNLCYCMPEIETRATLFFPTQEEQDGQVILATVQNSQNSAYTDTQKREFVTNHHKKIGLYPDKLFMEGTNGNVSFSMVDQQGIQIKSNTNLSFIADGTIYWEGKSINTTAPLEVVCRTSKSNIELCRDINLYAPGGVKTVGTGDGAKKKTDLNERRNATGQEIEHWQASFAALAAIPAVDLEKVQGQEDVVNLFACGGVPKVANGSTTIALSEVMEGKKESESTFPEAFRSMDNYTVKGGYALPEE